MGYSVPPPDPFAVAVTCIDGRTHEPLVQWVREHLHVDHVDLVTQPGADAALSSCPRGICDGIRERLCVSVTAHASRVVVIAGHDDCAANPVSAEQHRRHIAEAVREVEGWNLDVRIVGVWIDHDGTVTAVDEPETVVVD